MKTLTPAYSARFHVTYEKVTPESAENGDFSDHGFLDCSGWETSMINQWGASAGRIKEEHGMTLREALALVSGPFENNGDSRWFTQCDASQDYSTGEETRLSFHLPDGISDASRERIAKLLTRLMT